MPPENVSASKRVAFVSFYLSGHSHRSQLAIPCRPRHGVLKGVLPLHSGGSSRSSSGENRRPNGSVVRGARTRSRLMAGISIRRRTVELQKVISPATSGRLAPLSHLSSILRTSTHPFSPAFLTPRSILPAR